MSERLANGWEKRKTPIGIDYYYNVITMERSWEKPKIERSEKSSSLVERCLQFIGIH